KKIGALLLTIALACTMLVGCDSPASPGDNGPVTLDNIKVGFVHISDPSDMGYTYNHDLGTQEMQKTLGLRDNQIISKFNVPEGAACDTALRELVDAGCNIIFATSFGFEDYVKELAIEYPNVQFCHATGFQAASADLPNFHNYFASIYEGRYLAGIAAGLKTETNHLGYVAAFPFAEVISGYTAFYLGAKSVNPDVVMDIMYTHSWNDPTVEAQVTKALIAKGCDVISQHSDSTAPATTAEDNGVWQVGYNNDMIAAAPKASLISPRIDWSVYLIEAVTAVVEGRTIPVDWSRGLADNVVLLTPLNTAIAAAGTQEAIDAAAAMIKSGELKVFSGPLTGAGVDFNNKPVTIDLQAGEHFPEQEAASAPSWNYIIPGCTVIE
ncbi:MAG: BMP family ABC transporter substrate-binding protein, partial [Coriobacteriales bacterium]|nr:BMP family ABC transporter substrate-binding protein [Coriobacteriales bacterium]